MPKTNGRQRSCPSAAVRAGYEQAAMLRQLERGRKLSRHRGVFL